MKTILVACSCCSGSGKNPLSAPLVATLRAIKSSHPCTASEIYDRLKSPGLDRSAVNQRLKKLQRLGFLESKKPQGALRLYFPKRKA